MSSSLPPDLHSRWGHLRYIRQVALGEWHAECPYCGDEGHDQSTGLPDRFHMHGQDSRGRARGKCRKCGYFSWAEDEKVYPLREHKLIQPSTTKSPPVDLESVPIWFDYWLGSGNNGRQRWEEAGIHSTDQDRLYLGYTPSYNEGGGLTVPALTIPYFEKGFRPVTIQYRLIGGRSRYKFLRGMPQSIYLANPDIGIHGRCLLLEGAKKAIVVNSLLSLDFDSVAAVPNKTPSSAILEQLLVAKEVYVGLDPDANVGGESTNIAKFLTSRGIGARIIWWIEKPDDMVVLHGAGRRELIASVRQARPV